MRSVPSLDSHRESYSARVTAGTRPNEMNPGSHHDSLPKAASVYYPWFDWLRAVLAIPVMVGHDRLIPWAHSGNFAVRVFFALSGWLIGAMLMNTPRQHLT